MDKVGLFRHLGAMLYDSFFVIALLMLATVPWVVIFGESLQSHTWLQFFFRVYLLVIWSAYFLVFWYYRSATLGMVIWKIKLSSLKKERLTMKACLYRWLVAWGWLIMIPALYILAKKPTWHDKASQTQLVR